ncbi:MAG: helicase-associated domain-containing protein, partial [Anaerolineaceae bacterium]|nr:helicase-associated domain-containing protein [Anaerolineaceae bacterium]
MPDLNHCLQIQDLGFLQIVAELWGVDLTAADARQALPRLVEALLVPGLALEVAEALPETARQALDALLANEGWMPWSRFVRDYGGLREVGPGKRDREKPYLNPISATEVLWYRGMIGRDFLRREGDLQECAYIPDDLMKLLPPVSPLGPQPPGREATPGETKVEIPATDRVLDHCCTLLAALRLGDPDRSPAVTSWQPPAPIVEALLSAVHLITSGEQTVLEDARGFLEMPRGDALSWLVTGWLESDEFNELWQVPGLICEGAWRNDPQAARTQVLDWMRELPEGVWWSLDSFEAAIFERSPDYQRAAGDFDTWLIRDGETGDSLSGIEHWFEVDGALIRYLITGPLHWLGLVDLAAPAEGQPITAFRFSAWAADLLAKRPAVGLAEEEEPLKALSDGRIIAGCHTSRLARYQVSRFGLWQKETSESYTYQLSPQSLQEAAGQGLKISHLETLLNKYGEPMPPSLVEALHHWQKAGSQARIHPCVVLRVEDPKILQALRNTPAERFLSDPLSTTAVIIHPDAAEKVRAALARLGYLSDVAFIGAEV